MPVTEGLAVARRFVVWLLVGGSLFAVCLMLGFLVVAVASGKAGEPKVWLAAAGGMALFSGLGIQPLLPWLQRREPIVAGLDLRELRTLVRWLLGGDPLGRRLGRTRCHRCDHVRGAAEICPECGVERIDPR